MPCLCDRLRQNVVRTKNVAQDPQASVSLIFLPQSSVIYNWTDTRQQGFLR